MDWMLECGEMSGIGGIVIYMDVYYRIYWVALYL